MTVTNLKKLKVCFNFKRQYHLLFREPEGCREKRTEGNLRRQVLYGKPQVVYSKENVSLSKILELCFQYRMAYFA